MDLTEFQLTVLTKASKTRGYGGYASSSCRRHLERAWELRERMPEVSVFLAITAEEEAATAIFHALRKRKYDHADKLKGWDHRYKAGVYPFLRLIGDVLSPPEGSLPLTLYFDKEDQAKADILRIRMPISVKDGRQYCLIPEPPLGLVSKGLDGRVRDYAKEVRSVASERGIESIYEYIKSLANERNKMLYATDSSLPKIEDASAAYKRHSGAALLNLIMYLLIEPHKKQSLPQEALGAYLRILNRIEEKET
jgi:hypothetical protein